MGHPSSHCHSKKANDGGGSQKNDDDKSRSSKSSKTGSINKLQKKLKKSFATLETKIQELEKEDSDMTDSDSNDEASHFQFDKNEPTTGFQMTQMEQKEANKGIPHGIPGVTCAEATVLHQAFEKRNAEILFKKNHGKKIDLDLRNVILLDSQSTMDLFCNTKLVHNITKVNKVMRLKSNGGTMTVTKKATMNGYNNDVWFSKDAITNIIALSNLIKQY
jgi:hypothetical protein